MVVYQKFNTGQNEEQLLHFFIKKKYASNYDRRLIIHNTTTVGPRSRRWYLETIKVKTKYSPLLSFFINFKKFGRGTKFSYKKIFQELHPLRKNELRFIIPREEHIENKPNILATKHFGSLPDNCSSCLHRSTELSNGVFSCNPHC